MSDAPPSSNSHLTQALWFYFTLFVAFRRVLAYFFRLSAQTDFICKCKTKAQKLCAPSCLFLGWPPVQRKKISVGHSNAKTSVVRVKNTVLMCGLDSFPNDSVPFILLMRHVKLLSNQREPKGLSSYQQPTYTGTYDEDKELKMKSWSQNLF